MGLKIVTGIEYSCSIGLLLLNAIAHESETLRLSVTHETSIFPRSILFVTYIRFRIDNQLVKTR